jgi:uncharacterized protein with HEPN domain
MYIDDPTRLRHMLDSAREAVGFADGRSRADLDTDRMLQHALVGCVEIVGEAASQVSSEFREQHPEVAWREAASMRNRLIHAYFDVSLDIVWSTVTQDLPPLIAQLEQILTGGSQTDGAPPGP